MGLGIDRNGIVYRPDEGPVVIYRPARHGGPVALIDVPDALAEQLGLATGDVVSGETDALDEREQTSPSLHDEERDEPAAARGERPPDWLATRRFPAERLRTVQRINGLSIEEARERPYARQRRLASERGLPDRLIPLANGAADMTGRMLDLGAPFGLGAAGVIHGSHGSGMTRALRAVAAGIAARSQDVLTIVLLMRARGEEATEWRRRFPSAEVVVCPTGASGATAEETLRMADLALAAAQRQTELGKHVALLVDSLTGLWAAMLEAEEADAQREADQAYARRRVREWIQAAGNFTGTDPLGGFLGGSLTIVGTAWQRSVDTEAEEEGETHPHLRLLEHILHETAWRVALSGELSRRRLFPAIDMSRCLSLYEEALLGAGRCEALREARAKLAPLDLIDRYNALVELIETTSDNEQLIQRLNQHP